MRIVKKNRPLMDPEQLYKACMEGGGPRSYILGGPDRRYLQYGVSESHTKNSKSSQISDTQKLVFASSNRRLQVRQALSNAVVKDLNKNWLECLN